MIKWFIPVLALFIIIGVLGCHKPGDNDIKQVSKPDLTGFEIVDTIHIHLDPNRSEYVHTLDSTTVYETYSITTETDPELPTRVFHATDPDGKENFTGRLYLIYTSQFTSDGQIHETYAAEFPLWVPGEYSVKFLYEGGGMGSATIRAYVYEKQD